jgi:hypothetical protein
VDAPRAPAAGTMNRNRESGLTLGMTTTVVLRGALERGDIAALCERTCASMRRDPAGPVILDVSRLEGSDAVAVEAFARLQLLSVRLGRTISVRTRCGQLDWLLTLVGLMEVIPLVEMSPVETLGQAEEREQMRRVEEEGDGGDATS